MNSAANPLARLETLLEQGAPIAARHLPRSGQLLAELREKLKGGALQIMIFGAYNAGKSTMINALLGRAAAKVGDIPTTDVAKAYPWEGHILFDTPGVNAPIAHEGISRAQLDRADLILFVLRQEDQDAADIVRRLMDLIEGERPLFILLNSERSDPQEIEGMRARLLSVLVREAGKRRLAPEALERLPIVFLNALTACKARIEGKPRLLAASGYEDFQIRFMDWLRKHEEATRRLHTIHSAFDRLWFAPTLAALESRSAEPSELRGLEAEIRRIRREALNLEMICSNRIREGVAARREEIAELAEGGGGSEFVSAGLSRILEAVWSDMAGGLTREGVRSSSVAAASLDLRAQPLTAPLQVEASDLNGAHGALRLVQDAEKMIKVGGIGLSSAGSIPFLGAQADALSSFVGRVAPFLPLVTACIRVFAAQEAEDKHNQRLHEQALRKSQWIEEASAQIVGLLKKPLAETLDGEERLRLEPLEARRAGLRKNDEALERDLAEWRDLVSAFEPIRL